MTIFEEQALDFMRSAEAVDREMRRLEELSKSARNVKLSSEKNIMRAARGLQQALEQQARLAQELQVFGQAMLGMQARQEAAMLPLQARAMEVQSRMERHSQHMQRFGALGVKAKDAVGALLELSSAADDGLGGARAASEADQQVRGLIDETRALAEAAKADEFPEIAREAHALEQRVRAMRERLSELVLPKSNGAS